MVSQFLARDQGPRVIVYHQTHLHQDMLVSLAPLLSNPSGVTHIYIAAIHLNGNGSITLNDDHPDSERLKPVWQDIEAAQAAGIVILGMLGGAAQGSFRRLDSSPELFEEDYRPLYTLVQNHNLSGMDLDVEEDMSLNGIIRLIDRLRIDFGPSFLITLSPVASAMIPGRRHLSGFDYFRLEALRGHEIAWYNVQFYCGWADASNMYHYDLMIAHGWSARKLVLGLSTAPSNAHGFVDLQRTRDVLKVLRAAYPDFAGVAGWEFFRSLPGGEGHEWAWAGIMAQELRTVIPPQDSVEAGRGIEVPGIRPRIEPSLVPGALPFLDTDVKVLTDMGFSTHQVVRAMNLTSGNVEHAANLLLSEADGL